MHKMFINGTWAIQVVPNIKLLFRVGVRVCKDAWGSHTVSKSEQVVSENPIRCEQLPEEELLRSLILH